VYLSVIIRHTLMSNLSRSKIFVLRSFRNLSINGIWTFQNPTPSPLKLGNHNALKNNNLVLIFSHFIAVITFFLMNLYLRYKKKMFFFIILDLNFFMKMFKANRQKSYRDT
jgi:hypothetical protein